MGMTVERAREAADRLGVKVAWLRRRAVTMGLLVGGQSGRPYKGVIVGLLPEHWDLAAAPKVRKFVAIGSLEGRTGAGWRVILGACRRMGEPVFLGAPGIRAKYAVSVSTADRIVAEFRRTAKTHVTEKAIARVCGVSLARMRRVIAQYNVPVVKDLTRGGNRTLVDVKAAKEATTKDGATETVQYAATRHGVSTRLMTKVLNLTNVMGRRTFRRKAWLDPATVDAAVAAYRAPPIGRETVPEAARRVGVSVSTMWRWLDAEGIERNRANRRKAWLDPAIIDAVVNKHRTPTVGEA